MKNILRFLPFLCFFFFLAIEASATHNRAGEIIVNQIPDGECTSRLVEVIVITYTKTSSTAADRDSVTICWGDGTPCTAVERTNGLGNPPQGQPLDNDVKRNFYIAQHTYAGPGHYIVSMTDPNRNGGIINVNPGGSDNVQFHLQTGFTLFDGNTQGCNSTPSLLYPPIDYACIGQPFIHNPAATDPDGDSLSYKLTLPFQDINTFVPNYSFPNEIPAPNVGTSFNLNEITGDLTWDSPQVQGEYNVAFMVISWRNGVPIDTTIRDMQILVFDCEDNEAPIINTVDEICVVAGDEVVFNVTATDPNLGDKIKLSANGAPFELEISPASDPEIWRLSPEPAAEYETQPVTKTFRWQTTCEHISDLPYTVVFRAEDDYFLVGDNIDLTTGLATSKAVRITVVGPPPEDVQAAPTSEYIDISWESPYVCEDAQDEFFLSFSVWRKEGTDDFTVETCEPGLDGSGYQFLANTTDLVDNRYQYRDADVERGRTYCYRVLALFAKRTETGLPYNIVESLASEKVCEQLARDVPLLTNVSIEETEFSNGRIYIEWVPPLATDLDTLLNGPPYRYELRRAEGITPVDADFTVIETFEAQSYTELLGDTLYIDEVAALNTEQNPYTYDIAFFVNDEAEALGNAPAASSVFLSIEPTDNRNILSWNFDVPWANTKYNIYRMRPDMPGPFELIVDSTTQTSYVDEGLLNGREYCYYIEAFGSYGIEEIPGPFVNLSQEACQTPVDNVAPCPPELTVSNICDRNETCQEDEILENTLTWVNPMELPPCPNNANNLILQTDDVVGYNIYFSDIQGGEFQLIGTIDDSGETTFEHQPERGIAGCYAVTAVDTFLNESEFSNIICVDNCPNYELPNAFTPNSDNANDLFIPFPFCFIESVELSIFNRWGQLVYETKDPNIDWNGENLTGKQLPEGTYFYKCRVFEQRVTGTEEAPEILQGYIDLIR